jgi:hypothetical protein
MQAYPAIKVEDYLHLETVEKNLENVSYIIFVAPVTGENLPALHVTLFFNTKEKIPNEIAVQIFDKFCNDFEMKNIQKTLSDLLPVGFAKTSVHETPMPMLLVKQQERMSIPNRPMYVIDFLADSSQFQEAQTRELTGWSYVYDS